MKELEHNAAILGVPVEQLMKEEEAKKPLKKKVGKNMKKLAVNL